MIRSLVLLCGLAACSGGGNTLQVAPDGAFATLHDRLAATGVTYFSALPTAGTADYQGLVRLNLPLGTAPAVPYYGKLAVTVDFAGGPDAISGAVNDLQGAGGSVTGALQISGGAFYPDATASRDYQFSADLAGTLAQSDQHYAMTGALSGDFHGATGEGISGVIYQGIIRQGDVINIFDGAFAAERRPSGG